MSAADPPWYSTARAVLARYGIKAERLQHITQGLINLSVLVEASDGRRYVLQRLHPSFPRSVNTNIRAVSAHLSARQQTTINLLECSEGDLVHADDALWRVMDYINGCAYDAVPEPRFAAAAAATLAKFHVAMSDFDGRLVIERQPVHVLSRHLEALEAAIKQHRTHRERETVQQLHQGVLLALDAVRSFSTPREWLVHGDPKISNVLFAAGSAEAICLIDLDTLSYMPICFELGDAMRSWCNGAGEDSVKAQFDLAIFSAAMTAYAAHNQALEAAEVAAIVPATAQICLELAARFLTDALAESYFAWDPNRFASASAHNLLRAEGQLALASDLLDHSAEAEAIVQSAFG